MKRASAIGDNVPEKRAKRVSVASDGWTWLIDDDTGRVGVWRNFLPERDANALLDSLEQDQSFERRTVRIFGRDTRPRRETRAFGTGAYFYSGQEVRAADDGWGALQTLRDAAQRACQSIGNDQQQLLPPSFSFALVHRYPGADVAPSSALGGAKRQPAAGIGMHADDERDLQPGAPIFSYSLMTPEPALGLSSATPVRKQRTFRMVRSSDKRRVDIALGHNDALVMCGATQRHWKHGVPPSMTVRGRRYNATLRCMQPRK